VPEIRAFVFDKIPKDGTLVLKHVQVGTYYYGIL